MEDNNNLIQETTLQALKAKTAEIFKAVMREISRQTKQEKKEVRKLQKWINKNEAGTDRPKRAVFLMSAAVAASTMTLMATTYNAYGPEAGFATTGKPENQTTVQKTIPYTQKDTNPKTQELLEIQTKSATTATETSPAWKKLAGNLQQKAGAGNPELYPGYLDAIEKVSSEENLPPEILCAIIHRETHWRNITGDNGNGHGLMQIDRRYHSEWMNANNWQDPETNIRYGARLLNKFKIQTGSLRHAVAAYNAGTYRVTKAVKAGNSPDTHTTKGNYSKSIFQTAETLGWKNNL